MEKGKISAFEAYLNMICQWNRIVSLVSHKDEGLLIENHLLDSILGGLDCQLQKNERIMDLGSGNGFPAIPMKVFREDLSFTLTETNRKKVSFLREASKKLELKNIIIINGDWEKTDLSNQDRITARAFKKIDEIERGIGKRIFCGKISVWEKRGEKRIATREFCNVENL